MNAPDPAARINTALRDRYRVERKLGEGGMATVYLAEDLRHERKVALKVLRPDLAAVVGAERFLAEIKTTANLQHPHILPLFDSGEADGLLFYVMPYVAGESLRERLDRDHQLPVDDAVSIARKVADALAHAHRQGVVHRDIKPANIMLSDSGEPLVADFGIALALRAGGSARLTETGLSLGTPHYMSPEQASGDQNVGPATDAYALGSVLYEMLVGEPPFTGRTPQAVLSRIITGEVPSARAERASVPPHVDAVIARSLEKVPADRFRTPADFSDALDDPSFRHGQRGVPAGGSEAWWRRVAIATAAGGLVGWAGWCFEAAGPDPAPEIERYELTFLEGQAPTARSDGDVGNRTLALSPDGSRLAYVRIDSDGSQRLWLRPQDQEEATPIRGSEGARNPFFSPDGAEIGFTLGRPDFGLRTVPAEGGVPLTLVQDGRDIPGATWSPDGHVYYIDASLSLRRVPAVGGDSELVLEPDRTRGVAGLTRPEALPSGSGLLLVLSRGLGNVELGSDSVAVLDLDTGQLRAVAQGLDAVYLPPGYLIVVTQDGVLQAWPFDERRLEVTGPGVPIRSGLGTPGRDGRANMALSASGRLVYAAEVQSSSELIWVDRSGRTMPADSGWTMRGSVRMSLSPDGRRVVIAQASSELWMKELGGSFVRLPFDGGLPSWSPDGSEILFSADTSGGVSYDLWGGSPDGIGEPRLLADLDLPIAFGVREPGSDTVLVRTSLRPVPSKILRISPDDAVDTLLSSERVTYVAPTLSPDGRFLAYRSTDSSPREIYVRTYPALDSAWTISVGGGREPVWSHDGQRIYYKSLPDSAASRPAALVSVRFDPTIGAIQRTRLFDLPEGVTSGIVEADYAVAGDDERFLMIRSIEQEGAETSYHVVNGFGEEVRARIER